MVTLKKLENLHGVVGIDFEVSHSTPGPDGTTLTADLKMTVVQGNAKCQMKIEGCDGSDPSQALDRMEKWLRRLADGIARREEIKIPI